MVHSLEMTMIQHPLLSLRNMAFWALDSLLDALQVRHLHVMPSKICITGRASYV